MAASPPPLPHEKETEAFNNDFARNASSRGNYTYTLIRFRKWEISKLGPCWAEDFSRLLTGFIVFLIDVLFL